MGRSGWMVLGCVALVLTGCGKKAPFVVGVVGDLPTTEQVSDSGLGNGAFLAAGEINEKGGVNGRLLSLAVENDSGDPGLVPKVDERLLAKGAIALVGHNTSATTAVALAVADRHKVLLMSPEATSSQFSSKQDFFVRNEVSEVVLAEALANYAVQTLRLRSVGALLDERNTPFSRPFFEAFRKKMQALGGSAEILYAYQIPAASQTAVQVSEFLARGGEAVLLITGGEDTRKLAEVVRRVRDDVPVLGTPWAMPVSRTRDLGPLPESLYFPCTWDPDSRTPAYLSFKAIYEDRFGLAVDYHAVHSYEAINMVAHGIGKAKGRAANLPQTLVAIGQFQGLQGPIRIDAFGDCRRAVSILKVVGGVPRRVSTSPVN